MPKKRRKKRIKKKTFLLTIISLGIIVVSAYVFSTYFLKIYTIYREKQDLTKEIAELSEQEETLKSDVQKLQDPEYIARYAREKYSYSKDGEYIIKLP